jgi:ADP-L-glycero-D-manno-heptose 6-epimerase
MKILVTGYKGFIGQNVVNALQTDHELGLFQWGDPLPDFEGYDWCIHLGAISSTTATDVEQVLEQNYDFSRVVINRCDQYGVNLQYSSSASVYGLGTNFAENAPKSPLSPYAWSKYLFDRYVESFLSQGRFQNIKVQGFRYFNVYGPHEEHKGDQASPYHKFENQALETGVIKLFEGSENYLRDFIPVNTVVDIHKTFLDVAESGIWNVGTGRPKSFQTVGEEVASMYNAQIEYIPMPENLKKQYQAYTCADTTRLKQHYNI